MKITYFTSESVSSGHPDKICDQISDAVVDAALSSDLGSRVAVETLVTVNHIVMAGEVTCRKKLNYEKIARNVIKSLGYTEEIYQFSYKSPLDIYIHEQSKDIALGVDDGGAGDQGMMFGYATNENAEYMPMPIIIAHKLVARMDKVRESNVLAYLRPDGKSEVKVKYEDTKPVSIEHIVLAVPHDPKISNHELTNDLIKTVIKPVLQQYGYKLPSKDAIIVNGSRGRWEIGGPFSDTGVTGRKIIVDTYGAFARHGGGAFSGKDPTKVDRSGAYACRYIAKNIVASGLASRAEVSVAYVIGQKNPIVKSLDTFGTNKTKIKNIQEYAWNLLDLSVLGIQKGLNLKRPIYQKTAVYGHFGRNDFPWEHIVQ